MKRNPSIDSLSIQKKLHLNLRAQIRKIIGDQPASILKYYEAYKREFRGRFTRSTREELLQNCLESGLILIGDYHTFSQSQRTALRILRDITLSHKKIVLCLEMFRSSDQSKIDAFLKGFITEDEFLEEVDYPNSWGFPWPHYRPILLLAKQLRLKVIGLNSSSDSLSARDTHAARLITESLRKTPKLKHFVLYGDLHLARNHLPSKLKSSLKSIRPTVRMLTVYQNSETLFWKLAERDQQHSVDVVRLSPDRYCVMNASPWVKLQSYLQWHEAGENMSFEDEDDLDVEYSSGIPYHELLLDQIKHLSASLGLQPPTRLNLNIQLKDDLGFLSELRDKSVARSAAAAVTMGRSIYSRADKLVFLHSSSANALCETATRVLHCETSRSAGVHPPSGATFYQAVIEHALAYFGSKLMNHRRKCDLEQDLDEIISRKLSASALPEEKIQRKSAMLALVHLRAQKRYLAAPARKRRPSLYRASTSVLGSHSAELHLEVTRTIGFIIGEKLYYGLIQKNIDASFIRLAFRKRLKDASESFKFYLELTAAASLARLPRATKKQWM